MGFGEMLLILAVALIVVGPKKLPGLARTVGRGMAEIRRHMDDLQRTVQREIHAPLQGDEILRKMADAPAQVNPGPPPGAATFGVEAPQARADEPAAGSPSAPES